MVDGIIDGEWLCLRKHTFCDTTLTFLCNLVRIKIVLSQIVLFYCVMLCNVVALILQFAEV